MFSQPLLTARSRWTKVAVARQITMVENQFILGVLVLTLGEGLFPVLFMFKYIDRHKSGVSNLDWLKNRF
ncbi:MAG: hypothetical protein ACTSP4_09105 [Candidatus Hodarchaeales archaeon]